MGCEYGQAQSSMSVPHSPLRPLSPSLSLSPLFSPLFSPFLSFSFPLSPSLSLSLVLLLERLPCSPPRRPLTSGGARAAEQTHIRGANSRSSLGRRAVGRPSAGTSPLLWSAGSSSPPAGSGSRPRTAPSCAPAMRASRWRSAPSSAGPVHRRACSAAGASAPAKCMCPLPERQTVRGAACTPTRLLHEDGACTAAAHDPRTPSAG